jgi:hypothetical protein
MDDRASDIKPQVNGSCSWLPEHHDYKKWISSRRGLLWIKGKPGAGKSTLMKYCVQTVHAYSVANSSDDPFTVSFFFHGRGSALQKTPQGLFRSLSHQLLRQFPQHCSSIVKLFKKKNTDHGENKWNWHERELLEAINSSLLAILKEYSVRMFVDALDESGEDTAPELVRSFQQLYAKHDSASHSLSICFSCRHFPVIAPTNCISICVEDENQHMQDIAKYIQEELGAGDYGPELAGLQDDIFAQSQGVFQWVVLVIPRIISMYNRGESSRKIRAGLKKIPKELDKLYETTLDGLRLENPAQSLKLLQWICFALRPLTRAELCSAMNVDANSKLHSFSDYENMSDFIENNEQMQQQLRSLSGGLAEWKVHESSQQPIAQLIHQSVNDYLLDKGFKILIRSDPKLLDKSLANFVVGQAHLQLSRSCIRYISMDEILSSSLEDPQQLGRDFPLLEYATTNWIPHVEAVEREQISQEGLIRSFQWKSEQILHVWIDLSRKFAPSSKYTPALNSTLLHTASKHDLLTLVETILNLKDGRKVDINVRDSNKHTALHWAIDNGHEGIVKLLLENGAEAEGTYIPPVRKPNMRPIK